MIIRCHRFLERQQGWLQGLVNPPRHLTLLPIARRPAHRVLTCWWHLPQRDCRVSAAQRLLSTDFEEFHLMAFEQYFIGNAESAAIHTKLSFTDQLEKYDLLLSYVFIVNYWSRSFEYIRPPLSWTCSQGWVWSWVDRRQLCKQGSQAAPLLPSCNVNNVDNV